MALPTEPDPYAPRSVEGRDQVWLVYQLHQGQVSREYSLGPVIQTGAADVQNQFLTIINVESDRLTRLINDVLDLARYEAGQKIWNDQPNSMSDIVGSAVAGIQSLAIQKHLDVSVSLDSDLSDVWCDQDKINQVLTNLLSNAIKFTPEHGEIEVSVKESSAAGSAGGDAAVEIRVADNGVGIAAKDLDEIFKKFKQVGDTPSDVNK